MLWWVCGVPGPLDEATFNKMPLEFVGQQGFRWAGGPKNGGTELFYNGTYVSEGTVSHTHRTRVCSQDACTNSLQNFNTLVIFDQKDDMDRGTYP